MDRALFTGAAGGSGFATAASSAYVPDGLYGSCGRIGTGRTTVLSTEGTRIGTGRTTVLSTEGTRIGITGADLVETSGIL